MKSYTISSIPMCDDVPEALIDTYLWEKNGYTPCASARLSLIDDTLFLRMRAEEVFGESFACGSDTLSTVTFLAAEDAEIVFIPFNKVMHTCTMACAFHHRLVENMVRLIADKNRDLMRKVEVVSRKTLREKILAYLSLQAQLHESRYFEIPLGRVELADYLCADRSALTRELGKMREEGLIDYDKNMFRVF